MIKEAGAALSKNTVVGWENTLVDEADCQGY